MFRHVLAPPGMDQQDPVEPGRPWYIHDHCIVVDSADRLQWAGSVEEVKQASAT